MTTTSHSIDPNGSRSGRSVVVMFIGIAIVAAIAGTIAFIVLTSSGDRPSSAELAQRAVDIQWQGGAEVSVFMKPEATPEEIGVVQNELSGRADVRSFRYLNKQDAYSEAAQLFAGDDARVKEFEVETMPTSFRIVPTDESAIGELGADFQGDPGVATVTFARDARSLVKANN